MIFLNFFEMIRFIPNYKQPLHSYYKVPSLVLDMTNDHLWVKLEIIMIQQTHSDLNFQSFDRLKHPRQSLIINHKSKLRRKKKVKVREKQEYVLF